MATREEYEDAIKKIKEAFYSAICEEWELEQIAVNLDFLLSLINEHFKEHPETNYEHYKDEIRNANFDFALKGGKVVPCDICSCKECHFYGNEQGCDILELKWLYEQYKEKYKLTQLEYDLISAYITYHSNRKFCDCRQLIELKDKGHFKNVDKDALIKDILSNYEVIE